MLPNSRGAFAGILLAGLVLTACTSEVPGNPGGQTGSVTTPGATTTSSKPAARPAVLKVDGLDPCKGLTADQMKQLAVDRVARNDSDLVKTGEVPLCGYRSRADGFGYGVGYISNKGIDYWRSGSGNVDRKDVAVGGYDSVRTNLIGASNRCSFWVDVADGQMLYVDYAPLETKSLDEVCGKAQQGAELALATLKTLR